MKRIINCACCCGFSVPHATRHLSHDPQHRSSFTLRPQAAPTAAQRPQPHRLHAQHPSSLSWQSVRRRLHRCQFGPARSHRHPGRAPGQWRENRGQSSSTGSHYPRSNQQQGAANQNDHRRRISCSPHTRSRRSNGLAGEFALIPSNFFHSTDVTAAAVVGGRHSPVLTFPSGRGAHQMVMPGEDLTLCLIIVVAGFFLITFSTLILSSGMDHRVPQASAGCAAGRVAGETRCMPRHMYRAVACSSVLHIVVNPTAPSRLV
jgi:hypothetical protein